MFASPCELINQVTCKSASSFTANRSLISRISRKSGNFYIGSKRRAMSTIKAIRVEKFGDPSVLKVQNVTLPALQPHQLLIRVKAAGVNPVETYIRAGKYGLLPKLPYTPGSDAAGIVEAIGSDLSHDFKVGDRVYTSKRAETGTYAEKVIVNAVNDENSGAGGTYFLPDEISFEQGAAVGVPYFTAHRALMHTCKAKPGETVLIHGASGAVGLAACQIAANIAGLTVIGTAGTDAGLETVLNAGRAHFAVNHREPDYVKKIDQLAAEHGKTKQIDIIIEMLANENISKDLDMIGVRGRIAVIGNRGPTQIDLRQTMTKEASIIGVSLQTTRIEWAESAKVINDGLKSGLLRPVVDKTYRLEEAAAAHNDVIHSKGAKGKLVLMTE